MKKLYFILVLFVVTSLANATIHPIQVQGAAFSPATVNAVCGDTIGWVWAGAGSHTTTSTTIPGCATAWNAPISAISFTFAITVTCAGTYNYVCTPHGFTGVINVTGTCTNGVPSIDNSLLSSAYPIPFSNKFTVEASNVDLIALYNMLGEKIKTIAVTKGQNKTEISAADLREGIYFYCIIREGIIVETRKIVKN